MSLSREQNDLGSSAIKNFLRNIPRIRLGLTLCTEVISMHIQEQWSNAEHDQISIAAMALCLSIVATCSELPSAAQTDTARRRRSRPRRNDKTIAGGVRRLVTRGQLRFPP